MGDELGHRSVSEGLPYRVHPSDAGPLIYVCEACGAELPDGAAVDWVKGANGKHLGVRAYRAGAVGATPEFPNGQDEVVHDCSTQSDIGDLIPNDRPVEDGAPNG